MLSVLLKISVLLQGTTTQLCIRILHYFQLFGKKERRVLKKFGFWIETEFAVCCMVTIKYLKRLGSHVFLVDQPLRLSKIPNTEIEFKFDLLMVRLTDLNTLGYINPYIVQ